MSTIITDDAQFEAALSDAEWELRQGADSEEVSLIEDFSDPFPTAYVFDGGVFIFDKQPPKRLQPLVLRLCELANLPENWDSYGAQRIDPRCIAAAIELLTLTIQDEAALPIATPTNLGTVLLEWHRNGIDLELEVCSSQKHHLHYESQASEDVIDQDIFSDLTPLVMRLRDLS